MVVAQSLRPHMVVLLDGQVWRVLDVKAHAGGAQTRGVVHARLLNVRTRNESERRFRPEDRVEEGEVEFRTLQYSYRDGNDHVFLDPRTYDPVPVPADFLGDRVPFLTDGLPVLFECLGGDLVGCRFPESVELRVASTAPASRQAEANVWKEAFLENGVMIKVPPFIESGETVRVRVADRTYLERVHR